MERIGDFDNVYRLTTFKEVNAHVDNVTEQVDAAITESTAQISSLTKKRDELLARMDKGETYSLRDKTRDRLKDAPVIDALSEFHDKLHPEYIRSIFSAVREARLKGLNDKTVYEDVVNVGRQNLLTYDDGKVVFAQNLFVMNSMFDRTSETFRI